MRLILRAAMSLALVGMAACAAIATSIPAPAAGPDQAIRMEARHVPLGVGGATLAPGVRYGGGLILRGPNLHGLSDLKIQGDRAWVVSDFGALIRFTIRLDRNGRLMSADDAVSRPLTGPDGAVLAPKENADAEGLAILADGEVLVSFERDHRIWSYGVGATSPAAPVPSPEVAFPDNEGMEGLSADGDGWLVVGEGGGAWLCDRGGCAHLSDPMDTPADGFRFTGADQDPEGGWFVVERYYAPPLDMRVRVRRLSPEGVLSEPLIQLRPPASTDNFEGIAAVPTVTGTRLYLLSDDNNNFVQKTLLLAFDVRR
ncbi:esterase-like activity of phytase family protein [Brevundimonas sp.]|uniref:esterase-like activity of phytase family protein n=1 Tax=Brevundimonas sp. TaxID=1871086 RepID=UPI00286A4460|nr:esterase-like activity of phytase family protein [Brevundimonas sp.]